MELLSTPPDPTTFVPLTEHQSATPASFFNGPPVLHLRCPGATLRLRTPTAPALALFAGLSQSNGSDTASSDEISIPNVTVYVLSTRLVLHRAEPAATVAVPYPTIGLHATAGDGLYLQLSSAAPDAPAFDDHDPDGSVEATIVPQGADGGADGVPAPADGGTSHTPLQALYAALSACADLHPDPLQDDSDDDGASGQQPAFEILGADEGGMPPPVPGSGGWITADNLGEFFDDQGNWRGEGPEPTLRLGPGAGTVRDRGDGEDQQTEDDTKWQRTN